ncbi:hypothetical protein B0H16DRAFT_1826410 [Mycena metata]|uniref:Uncharacterized protein n=1 Tax=Mycena metata TaxID=1033252 RepID=A0AAD7GUQ8_9AGAR|nr:hypothetical protein B0H16DRAFT_1826410 [Mycena metata]
MRLCDIQANSKTRRRGASAGGGAEEECTDRVRESGEPQESYVVSNHIWVGFHAPDRRCPQACVCQCEFGRRADEAEAARGSWVEGLRPELQNDDLVRAGANFGDPEEAGMLRATYRRIAKPDGEEPQRAAAPRKNVQTAFVRAGSPRSPMWSQITFGWDSTPQTVAVLKHAFANVNSDDGQTRRRQRGVRGRGGYGRYEYGEFGGVDIDLGPVWVEETKSGREQGSHVTRAGAYSRWRARYGQHEGGMAYEDDVGLRDSEPRSIDAAGN